MLLLYSYPGQSIEGWVENHERIVRSTTETYTSILDNTTTLCFRNLPAS